MVTILQVVPRLDAGGSELATLEIAQALVKAGATALVVSEGGEQGKTERDILHARDVCRVSNQQQRGDTAGPE